MAGLSDLGLGALCAHAIHRCFTVVLRSALRVAACASRPCLW